MSGMAGGGKGRESKPDWQGETDVATKSAKKLEQPRLYRVLLHNDDYSTMDFVVLVLTSIFNHKSEEAVAIMLSVHKTGIGVAGIYSSEVAETKMEKTHALAKEHEHPLRCSMEPE